MKAKTTLFVLSDSDKVVTEEEVIALGYKQNEELPDGFLTTSSGSDYAERITAFKVHSGAVDGTRKPRMFKSVDGVINHLRSEQWLETGVSDDGVSYLNSVCARCSTGSFFNYDGVLPMLRKLAREEVAA